MSPKQGTRRCPDCDRTFSAPMGLEMHRVRIHRQRVNPDTSHASSTRATVEKDASADTSNDTSDASRNSSEDNESTTEQEGLIECPEGCGALFRDEAGIDGHIEEAHTEAPPPPPSESQVVGEVAESLPRPIPMGLFAGKDRLVRVRSMLASARRKAARHPYWDSEQIVRMFWDGSDRKVLESLRSKGVDILGRNSVENGANGG